MKVVFLAPGGKNTTGKLADVELHFSEPGELAGFRFIGMGLWPHPTDPGGAPRVFGLRVLPIDGGFTNRMRDEIVEAWAQRGSSS